jgi:hypothetical protein
MNIWEKLSRPAHWNSATVRPVQQHRATKLNRARGNPAMRPALQRQNACAPALIPNSSFTCVLDHVSVGLSLSYSVM